jgi:hypothetical protein
MNRSLRILLASAFLYSSNLSAQSIPKEYQAVLEVLGRKGDFKDQVLKVNIPRSDLHVTIAGIPTPTPFGFGGWVAMTKGENGNELMMGDLVLLEDEVNPVMSALLDQGLEVTALHNHFFWDVPRVFYMHVHGHGTAADLTRRIKPALDLLGCVKPSGSSPAQNSSAGQVSSPSLSVGLRTLDTGKVATIIGHSGEQVGPVYKITIGRPDIDLREMGARIDSRMGLNTWAAFIGDDSVSAVAGDVAMLEGEVVPVLKALRQNGLEVVAIHHHMTGTRPMVIFLHYWRIGTAEKLAGGVRAALAELGHQKSDMMRD